MSEQLLTEPDSSTNGSDFEYVNGNGNSEKSSRNMGTRTIPEEDESAPLDSVSVSSSMDELDDLEMQPHPVQVVTVNRERQFDLDLELLSDVLLDPRCRDTPVVVVSIAGDFRKGKSFMLNFFLRYLYHISSETTTEDGRPSSTSNEEDWDKWLGEEDAPLKGFSWRGGSERDTTGILLWSEPILVTDPRTKNTVAVLLMDTQGAFDSEFTVRDSATVFALSTMTSSIQVFNLMHNLQEDNLQVLEIFTEYGRLALEDSEVTPFQKLVFLIRDWSFPYESPYGLDGGMALLNKKLTIKENQPEQLKRVRSHIKKCFSDIECFLLPHPGNRVATNPTFDGKLTDMDPDFRQELKKFVPHLLSPRSLVNKTIGGQTVTGRQLMEYFKAYINIFRGDSMPEPKSMLEATAEANNLAAVAAAKEHYMDSMEELCGGERPYMNPKTLQAQHERILKSALKTFNSTRKMGGEEYSVRFLERLSTEITQAYEHFEAQNKSKNLFNLWGTPLVLLLCWLFATMVSKLFDLIGISLLANLFFFHSVFAILTIIAYLSARYTGNFPDFILAVDGIAEKLWTHGIEKLMEILQTQAQQQLQQQMGLQPPSSTREGSSSGSRRSTPRRT